MLSTGKSEITASIFVIASNDFTHEAPAEEEDCGPKRRNRGNKDGTEIV
jgi:hypothetical protein